MMRTRALVTGGAGFIGSNLADRLLAEGHEVTIFDNCSRPGARANLTWLRQRHPALQRVVEAPLTDFDAVCRAAEGADRVYHLAGQVAVTTAIADPRADFEANALGTFNLLEAARSVGNNPVVLYSSTNKVYGGMEDVAVVEEPTRYRYADLPHGVPESQPLDFHSPYGCSKGAGDQYTRDYFRIYGLRTVVLRQSCIYGRRQLGHEDQGWLAWFIIAALQGRPITIYGDGKQVRDILYIDDLLDAYEAAVRRIDAAAGQVYNVGGGPANSLSIWAELGPLLERCLDRPVPVTYGPARAGDQRIYVSDIHKAERDLGWRPRVGAEDGFGRLFAWLRDHHEIVAR